MTTLANRAQHPPGSLGAAGGLGHRATGRAHRLRSEEDGVRGGRSPGRTESGEDFRGAVSARCSGSQAVAGRASVSPLCIQGRSSAGLRQEPPPRPRRPQEAGSARPRSPLWGNTLCPAIRGPGPQTIVNTNWQLLLHSRPLLQREIEPSDCLSAGSTHSCLHEALTREN